MLFNVDPTGGQMTTDQYCFHGGKSCVPDLAIYEDVPKNNNVYKVIRARSWYNKNIISKYKKIGRACNPTTPCKYWSYRHGKRKCYLLKSCKC